MSSDCTLPLVVGLGLRLPGARGPNAAWDVLRDGRCTISQVDTRLFDPAFYLDPHRPRTGKAYTFAAGQIDNLYHFDAGFFGIPPRAAKEMDTQQRLMLQTVWEAVEDAGLNIRDLAGDRTGVFVGASLVEELPKYYLDPTRGGSHFMLGNTLSIVANRISATFDFRGPSYVLDTACSSGLNALHHANSAIREGHVDAAIVGGVHVVRLPGGFVGFSQARMLSPSGQCRAFDADADGYVRSEACVALLLMHPKLAADLAPRRRARLLASGVNSDGAARPLAVPAPERQDALLTNLLRTGDRDPEDLDFYEAHGTGTQVGDPVEATALGSAIGQLRRDPLLIGSAKTNFGHAEPAAGLVGLAKTLLAMEHRLLPASLKFETPNPNIDFDGLNLSVAAKPQPLTSARAVIAGVNSFGFGGTNVAALLESCDTPSPRLRDASRTTSAPWLLLSAASAPALLRLRATWADTLVTSPKADWPRLAASASKRAELAHRFALPLDRDAPQALLSTDAELLRADGQENARTVFAFPGNGAQHPKMGRSAYAGNRSFREAFDETSAAFADAGLPGLRDLLHVDDLEERLFDPRVGQPLLFACQVAQARALIAAGVKPAALIGHSLGEITALHLAGAFNLKSAALIVARRSARFAELRGIGGMITIAASVEDTRRVLGGFDDTICIAAVNGPNSVTVSGPKRLLERFSRAARGQRFATVHLSVDVPYHSPALDPLEKAFRADLEDIAFQPLALPVAGACAGKMLVSGDVSADYLWRNARAPVEFVSALRALSETGPVLLLEIAPKPVLAGPIRDCARLAGMAVSHHAPDPSGEDPDGLAASVWVKGAAIDRSRIGGDIDTPVPLPTYPWDESEYFAQLSHDGFDGLGEKSLGILAGRRIDRQAPVWVSEFTPTQPAWVADHSVGDRVVLPASALIEIALSAGAAFDAGPVAELAEFDILCPPELGENGIRIRTEVDETTGAVRLSMRPRLEGGEFALLAQGTLRWTPDLPRTRAPECADWTPTEGLYERLSTAGLTYGPAFQGLKAVAPARGRRIWCKLRDTGTDLSANLDPVRLDAAFHGLAVVAREIDLIDAASRRIYLPVRMGRIRARRGKQAETALVEIVKERVRSFVARVTLFDAKRRMIAKLEGVEFLEVRRALARQPEPFTFERRRPLSRAPDASVIWPKGWSRPAKALSAIGFSQTGPAGSTELRALRQALTDGGSVEHALANVLTKTPALVPDARVLVARAGGDVGFDIAQHTTEHRTIWQLADRLTVQIVKNWHPDERLSILVVGLVDGPAARRWCDMARIDALTLWHPDEYARAQMVAALPDDLHCRLVETVPPGSADLVLVLGEVAGTAQISDLAAPGALVLRLDTPDPYRSQDSDDGTWFLNADPLTLRLRIAREGSPRTRTLAHLVPTQSTHLVVPGPASPASIALPAVFLSLDHRETASEALARLLMLLKQRLREDTGEPLRLLLWNRGAPDFDVVARAMGSVIRTARNEHPQRAVSLIAVAEPPPDALWPAILDTAKTEPVLHVRGAVVRLDRVMRRARPAVEGRNAVASRSSQNGHTIWRSAHRPRLKPGHVEVETAATGLNFRDVLWAAGQLPDRLFDLGMSPPGMGMEIAGHVTRCDPETGFAVGQKVMAFAPESFARQLVLPKAALLDIPERMTPTDAAGVPVAFATAWDSLMRVGRLEPGETVLIHGAAGGVGMAAIQIALAHGARVIATAGSPDKQALVKALGADAVFSSRDLGFGDRVMTATGGRGVDVVLNSLSGRAQDLSLRCLAPLGRFIELGKQDVFLGTRIDPRPFRNNLSFQLYDLDQRLATEPAAVRQTMLALAKAFAQGRLRPLPTTVFEAEALDEALAHMRSARHVGKIVVTPPPQKPKRRPRTISGTWVILGGTGGIGLALASELRRSGAQAVHLVSRAGVIPPGAGADGARAQSDPSTLLHALDARDPEPLGEFLRSLGPVTGIIHAAMSLRDRMITDLDASETRLVIGSKLGVAETLDTCLRTNSVTPDHVIFLSSIAAYLGNPGQSAYAASNAGMEAIAEARRRDGLACHVVALGPIGDGGALARDAAKRALLARVEGMAFLSIDTAINAIMDAIRYPSSRDSAHAAIDWRELARFLPGLVDPGFSCVLSAREISNPAQDSLVSDLRTLPWAAAVDTAYTAMRDMLGIILRLPNAQVDLHKPLSRIGIDSLMAMELRLEVERRFGQALPVSALTETTSPADLTVKILTRLRETPA